MRIGLGVLDVVGVSVTVRVSDGRRVHVGLAVSVVVAVFVGVLVTVGVSVVDIGRAIFKTVLGSEADRGETRTARIATNPINPSAANPQKPFLACIESSRVQCFECCPGLGSRLFVEL